MENQRPEISTQNFCCGLLIKIKFKKVKKSNRKSFKCTVYTLKALKWTQRKNLNENAAVVIVSKQSNVCTPGTLSEVMPWLITESTFASKTKAKHKSRQCASWRPYSWRHYCWQIDLKPLQIVLWPVITHFRRWQHTTTVVSVCVCVCVCSCPRISPKISLFFKDI